MGSAPLHIVQLMATCAEGVVAPHGGTQPLKGSRPQRPACQREGKSNRSGAGATTCHAGCCPTCASDLPPCSSATARMQSSSTWEGQREAGGGPQRWGASSEVGWRTMRSSCQGSSRRSTGRKQAPRGPWRARSRVCLMARASHAWQCHEVRQPNRRPIFAGPVIHPCKPCKPSRQHRAAPARSGSGSR